jgi:hypothetical protein
LFRTVQKKYEDVKREVGNLANHLHRASSITAALDPRVRAELREIDPGFEKCIFAEYPSRYKINEYIGKSL